MPANVTAGFEQLADSQFAMDAGAVTGGVVAGESLGYLVEGHSVAEFDVPSELGGVAVVAGAEVTPGVNGRLKRHAQVGGGVAILLSLADRLGAREKLNEVFA